MSQQTKERKRLDPAKTRESIMRAAFKVFADKGYKGASIADIAHAAQVRKSLIQYHFGTKDQLWNACLESKAAPMIAAIDKMIADESPDFGELVVTRFKFLRDNPDVRRLLSWASMGPIPAPQFMIEKRKQLLEAFTSDLKGEKLARMLFAISATEGWFHFRSLYGSVIGVDVHGQELEQEFLKILVEVAPQK